VFEANAEPPEAVLDALARHKHSIFALLRPGQTGWTAKDWRAYFDERIEIAMSNNGPPRAEAEALAFEECVIEWLNQRPVPSAPGRCAWCGKAESPAGVVLPFGTEPGTHAWLHPKCWATWHEVQKADAIAALAALGRVGVSGHVQTIPDLESHRTRLREPFGNILSDEFVDVMMRKLIDALRPSPFDSLDEATLNAGLAIISSMQPQSELEALLAVQIIATGTSGLRFLRESHRQMTEDFIRTTEAMPPGSSHCRLTCSAPMTATAAAIARPSRCGMSTSTQPPGGDRHRQPGKER
jgi:hypothetical protein